MVCNLKKKTSSLYVGLNWMAKDSILCANIESIRKGKQDKNSDEKEGV